MPDPGRWSTEPGGYGHPGKKQSREGGSAGGGGVRGPAPGPLALLFGALLWHGAPLGLPQVVVDGEGVHAHRHRLGGDGGELLAVRAVLVHLVDHLLGDALGPRARQLVHLLRVGDEGVERAELAAAVPEQDQQVVGVAALQLLVTQEEDGLIHHSFIHPFVHSFTLQLLVTQRRRMG